MIVRLRGARAVPAARLCTWLLAACCGGLLGTVGLHAADPRPSWDCLPESTVAAIRMPEAANFLRAVRDQTKFGATMLSSGRLEGIQRAFIEAARDADVKEEFDEWLAKHGLSRDDLKALAAGDMGVGLVMPPAENDRPAVRMMLGWIEPGQDAAGRLLAAAKQLQEESQDEPHPTRRVDLSMAGHEVTWLASPLVRPDMAGIDIKAGDAEKFAEFQRELAARVKEGKVVVYDESNLFLCPIGGRILFGMTLPDAGTNSQLQLVARDGKVGVAMVGKPEKPDAQPDKQVWEARAEAAKGVFERFLAAHAEGGESPLAASLQTPGMQEVLPAGLPLVELVVRPAAVMAAFGLADMTPLRQIGLDELGPLAWRQSLDKGTLRSGLFIPLPAPRGGLVQILDQRCDESDVPPFVTAEAIDLTQISLDLGDVYTTVRQFATAGGEEQVRNMFNTAEAQTLGLIGVELPKLLSSLGSRHWIVSYPPRIAEAMAAARQARDGDAAARQVTPNRFALVWQVEDEGPFAKILQRLAPLAGGDLKDEQGFRGLRLPGGAAVFLGHRHLLVAVGEDTLEKTMSAIRNPPAAEASLRESDALRRIRELMPLPACRAFGVNDNSRTGGFLGSLRDIVAALAPEDVPEESRTLLAAVQPLLPTPAEMEGIFGAGGWTLEATDRGVALRSACEMPAP